MTAGKLAAAKPAATTNTTLYRCPINAAASAVLEVCNQGGSAASYRAALRDYDQVLTLNAATYNLVRGNVLTNYKLTISPGISTDQFDPGDLIQLADNQGNFKIADINKPTETITYDTKVEPLGTIAINSGTQSGTFAAGQTITGATTGLTAVIYRVATTNLFVKLPQVGTATTSVVLNNVSGIAANDFISTNGEIMLITALSSHTATVTRAQIGTTAVAHNPGQSSIVFRAQATTTTINEGAAFAATDTTLTVASAASLIVGDYLRVGNELMQITAITTNDLTVIRGALGTTAAAHANGATLTVHQTVQVPTFQFFNFTEIVSVSGGASVNLGVVAGSGAVFTQGNKYVYALSPSTTYEFPVSIAVDADRIVRFTQSDSSNSGHPLKFSLTADGTHGAGGTEFTTGVTINGTPGTAGAYSQINLDIANIGANAAIFLYCQNHPQMTNSGFLAIDLTPNYTEIFIYDISVAPTTSNSFKIENTAYTITAISSGPYGYVQYASGATVKVTRGYNEGTGLTSVAFAATNTFFDSPLKPASDRTLATVSSVSEINAEDYFYFGKTIASVTTDRTTGLVVGPGQTLMVYSSAADLSYVVQGFEDTTSDFTVVHYIRQRPASV